MLINLYNGKPVEDFSNHYATIAQIFDTMKKIEQQLNGREITADEILEKFNEKIVSIVGTVKDKLHEDARKDELFTFVTQQETSAPVSAAGRKSVKQTSETMVIKEYPKHQGKFDEILSAVGDYFDLFKNNTNKLEDLWL